jgi:hypothetical protein
MKVKDINGQIQTRDQPFNLNGGGACFSLNIYFDAEKKIICERFFTI